MHATGPEVPYLSKSFDKSSVIIGITFNKGQWRFHKETMKFNLTKRYEKKTKGGYRTGTSKRSFGNNRAPEWPEGFVQRF